MSPRLDHPLLAAATLSKKAVNQDAYALAERAPAGLAGIVVTDGLGSHFGAEVASRLVAECIGDGLRATDRPEALDVPALFDEAWQRLYAYWHANLHTFPPNVDPEAAFGTTAICCVESPDELVAGYTGNGALLHLRGNFNAFPASQLLPWSAMNYLNPHALPRGGKNPLYKLLSPAVAPSVAAPSVLRIGKDRDTFGDIMVCATDGIASFDQTPMGLDASKRVWISGEESVALLFRALDGFFTTGDLTRDALARTLEHYLAQLEQQGLVSDDCTLAVLVTDRAAAYQRSRGAPVGVPAPEASVVAPTAATAAAAAGAS